MFFTFKKIFRDWKTAFKLIGLILVSMIAGSLLTGKASAFVFGSQRQVSQWIQAGANLVGLRTETNNLRIGSAGTLFVNTGSGKVGIGTIIPEKNLEVRGNFGAGANGTEFVAAANGNITGGTYNGLSLSGLAAGFSIAGGTINKTLLLDADVNASELVTLAGSQTLANKILTSPDIAKIGNLTAAGFVKTSGADGTLIVDPNNYLTSYSETDPVVKAITGLVKSDGSIISAAASGADYSAGTAALATGILKSTAVTGVLSIAVAGDFPILNQSTTGNAATATNLTGLTATISNLNSVTGLLGTAAFTASADYATAAQGTLATNALPSASFTDAAVTGKLITGYASGSGTVAATDTILQAINKLNGNSDLKAPLASPTFTGTVAGITALMVGLGNVTDESKATMFASPTFTGTATIPTPFILGAVSVTATGTELNLLDGVTAATAELNILDGVTAAATQLNYLASAGGITGTASTNLVFSASPTIVTPVFTTSISTPSIITASGDLTLDPTGNVVIKGSTADNSTAALNVTNSTSANLLYVRNDGRVGFGTAEPVTTLDVNGTGRIFSNTGGAYMELFGTGDTYNFSALKLSSNETTDKYWQFQHRSYAGETNNFSIEEFDGSNYNQRLVIKPGGNVGIGTTAPAAKLEIADANYPVILGTRTSTATNTNLSGIVAKQKTTADMVDGFGTSIAFSIEDGANVANVLGAIGAVRDGADNSGALIFDVRLTGAQTEKMRITSAGSVGIGTTTPTQKLSVLGGYIQADSNSQAAGTLSGLYLTHVGSSETQLKNAIVSEALNSWGTGKIHILQNTTGDASNASLFDAKVTISSGNVGIGTTSPSSQLSFGANIGKFFAVYEGAGAANKYGIGMNGDGSGGNPYRTQLWANGSEYMSITSGGNVGIGTATPATQLHLDNSLNAGPQITLSAPSGGTPAIVFRPFQPSAQWSNPAQAMISATDLNFSANLRFWTKTPGALANALVERMTIQNDGKVGIGTTAPDELLSINAAAGTNRLISFKASDVTKGYAGLGTDNVLRLQTADTANVVLTTNNIDRVRVSGATGNVYIPGNVEGDGVSMGLWGEKYGLYAGTYNTHFMHWEGSVGVRSDLTILNTGNVGIGTESPAQKLDVSNGTVLIQGNTQLGLKLSTTVTSLLATNWYRIATLSSTNSPMTVKLTLESPSRHQNIIINIDKGTGYYTAEVYEGGRYAYAQNIKNVRIVDAGVNNYIYVDVQVGSDEGAVTYIVLGDYRGNAANGLVLNAFVDQGTGVTGHIYPVTSVIRSFGDGVSAGPVLTLKEGGSVGIGTTVPGAYKLHVEGGMIAQAYTTGDIMFRETDAGPDVWRMFEDTHSLYTQSLVTGQTVLTIKDNGSVGIGTTSPGYQLTLSANSAAKPTSEHWTISSDARLKENIIGIPGALQTVLRLNGREFGYIDKEKYGASRQYGFIAQEVESIIPRWVQTGADGYKTFTIAGDTALLVEAIKEQQAQIEGLRLALDSTGLLNATSTSGLAGQSGSGGIAGFVKQALADLGLAVENGVASVKELAVDKFFADKVKTNELCLDDVCVTKEQLRSLLDRNASAPVEPNTNVASTGISAPIDAAITVPASPSATTTADSSIDGQK